MIQRILDILIIFFLSPLIFLILLVVFLLALFFHKTDIFFVQARIGKGEKIFSLYKFRTMVHNAQNIGSGLYSYSDDTRITKLGKVLRRSSLDELPQLFNVLKGDMSFVGPRPAVVGELEAESSLPINYEDRFSVKPGLTGWAQIHGRDSLNWSQKITYDLQYVSFSPYKKVLLYFFIIFFTPFYLFNFSVTYERK
jgi:undecaprenyl phosphate N,N'-diacetylbacillosamine 1-phosphate transferase